MTRVSAPDGQRTRAAASRVLLAVEWLTLIVVSAASPGCRSERPSAPARTTMPATAAAVVTRQPRPQRTPPGLGCASAGCHDDLQQRQHVHGPIAAGGCDACHGAEQDGHLFPLQRAGDAACTLCHVVTTGKPFVHAAIKQSGCIGCHDPHGSDTKFLLTADTLEASCRQCHPATEQGEFKHGPFAAGACSVCHLPHEADNPELTILTGSKHCFRCHLDRERQMAEARTVHRPAAEGCTNCHHPHAGPFPKMLAADPDGMCFTCHADVEEQVRTATAKHGAVFTGKRCLNCHDVHASGQPALLAKPMVELCLTCHGEPQTADDGRTIPDMRPTLTGARFLHGPIREGECQACHQVHGSNNERLLTKYFAGAFYQGFDLTNYALCFSCHEKALVLDKETTTLTDFRNGERNLHYLHVNRLDKGRSCKACHEMHGSNQPRHMAEAVPFEGGGWPLPIRFEKNSTGGSCAPGCHQPYEYDREKPVSYPSGGG